MNWGDLENNPETQNILDYWQTLGQFRASHMALGAGVHHQISKSPFTFSRILEDQDHPDRVVVAVLSDADIKKGSEGLRINVGDVFAQGTEVRDAKTGMTYRVQNNEVRLSTFEDVVLLESVN
jgi:alpha-amylase